MNSLHLEKHTGTGILSVSFLIAIAYLLFLLCGCGLVDHHSAKYDFCYIDSDGAIRGLDTSSGSSEVMVKSPGKWLLDTLLQTKFHEKWQTFSSSAFYDQITHKPHQDKLYFVSVWSKDGGDANAAFLFCFNIKTRKITVISDVSPYPSNKNNYYYLSADGNRICYIDDSNKVWIMDSKSLVKKLVKDFLNWSGDFKKAFNKENGGITIVNLKADLDAGSQIAFLPHASKATWSPDSEKLLYFQDDGTIWVYDLALQRNIKLFESNKNVGNTCWSPDSKSVALTIDYWPNPKTSEMWLIQDINKPVRLDLSSYPQTINQQPVHLGYLEFTKGDNIIFFEFTEIPDSAPMQNGIATVNIHTKKVTILNQSFLKKADD
ncbi:MAG: hypothetical protein ACM3UZ_04645 [Acidobacteriota bacterium]